MSQKTSGGSWLKALVALTCLGLLILVISLFTRESSPSGPSTRRSGATTQPRDVRKVFSSFGIGVGDRYDKKINGKWVAVWKEARRLGIPVRFQAVWFTRKWKPFWATRKELKTMAVSGVIPVAISYFWGDHISRRKVRKERGKWLAHIRRLSRHLDIGHPVLLVLEPEYNNVPPKPDQPVTEWDGFNDLLLEGMRIARAQSKNLLLGPCPGDFGSHNLERGIGRAMKSADFIAFQEMRGSTREGGYKEPYERADLSALRFSRYLKQTFKKPILLAYLAVSSYGRSKGSGEWRRAQERVMRRFAGIIPELRQNGLFGALLFQLFDDPRHKGFFGEAEKHFGVLDHKGRPKPALRAFKEWAERFRPLPTSRPGKPGPG